MPAVDVVIRLRGDKITTERQWEVAFELRIVPIGIHDPGVQFVVVFKSAKQEELVFLNRSPNGAARFITMEITLGGLEIIESTKILVAEEEKSRAMETVRARPLHNIDERAHRARLLRREASGYDVELLDGIGTDVVSESADNEIIVLEAVDIHVRLPSTCARNANVTDALLGWVDHGSPHHLWNEGRERL